ncbi:MAG: YigZ family protein [Flavobacteriales bacterium]|nr:YigZ family protein [Flavobacteriales bacterium]
MSFKYNTIGEPGKSLYKVKGSKHFGYSFNVQDEEDISNRLKDVAEEHHSARHIAYAWRLGAKMDRFRANDDGEPTNSAGKPILGQIEKYALTNTLIAVVRYFGGTKLGVGGLIDAYRTAAETAINEGEIIERQLLAHFRIHFGYERMSDVMQVIRINGWEDHNQIFEDTCTLDLKILPENREIISKSYEAFSDIRIEHLGTY